MYYRWNIYGNRLKKKAILLTVIALNVCFLDCKRNPPNDYYVSLEELTDTIEIAKVLGENDPNITVYITNEKDSIPISILSSEIRTVRKNRRNKELFTSFSSLDSVIEILSKRNSGIIPINEESPRIFFVDSNIHENLMKIIPARQMFRTGADNFERFQ